MSLLFLLRHAATENNLAHPPRLQGRRSDLGLSAEGRRQAVEAGRFLAARRIDAVYSSPLLRAVETAAEIARPQGLSTQVVNDLIECDVGQWEGRDWGEIERTEPKAYQQFVSDPATYPYAGGENLEQVRARVIPVMDGLLADSPGKIMVVVAHNLVNRVYLAHHLGLPIAKARGIHQDHCGLNAFRCEQGRVKLISVNSVFHLGGIFDF